MESDIRLLIGALFTILGVVLTLFGAVSDKTIYERSLGININLEWGLVMFAFGVIMVLLGRRRAVHHGDLPRTEEVRAPEEKKTSRTGMRP